MSRLRQITIRLDESMFVHIDRIAGQHQTNTTDILRKLIQIGLKKNSPEYVKELQDMGLAE